MGYPGAAIDIVHLERTGDPVRVELLAYHGVGPDLGPHHDCITVEDIEEELIDLTERGNWSMIGRATIPDGPNQGTKAAYVQHSGGHVRELIQLPK